MVEFSSRNRLILGTLIGLALAGQAQASGWVKGEGDYYLKVFGNTTQSYLNRSGEASTNYDESVSQFGYYVEAGLPAPWALQAALSGSRKSIERESTELGDKFSSEAMTDVELSFKHGLWSGALGGGVSLSAALETGLIFPVTPKEYRSGEESERQETIDGEDAGRSFLISAVDRGRSGSVYGLGTSFSFRGLWLDLGRSYTSFDKVSNGLGAASGSTQVNLGVGLPSNSWVQVGVSRNADYNFEAAAAGARTNVLTLSGGWTAFGGYALEVGVDRNNSIENTKAAYNQYTVGISHRKL